MVYIYIHILVTPQLCVRPRRAGKGTSYSTGVVLSDDVLDRRVCTRAKHNKSNNKHDGVQDAERDVLRVRIPLALLDELEPEKCGPVECESGDEQRGDETEKCVEEGNGLSDDPSNYRDEGDESNPDAPTLRILDISDSRGRENTVHDVAADYCTVNGTGDEDDGERDAEGDAGDSVTSGKKSRGLDLLADESIDESTSHGVDENLNQT